MPATARRVRMLTMQRDGRGRRFMTFAVDRRYGFRHTWQRNSLSGCVYAGNKTIYIKRGSRHYDYRVLFGKKHRVAAKDTCTPSGAAPGTKLARR
jgi:hypothetical protein